ncbi:MAG: hypothetical protein IKX00_01540 [Bacilli bacterium]|nr:hypothetical protein [Bacilli bacterium]
MVKTNEIKELTMKELSDYQQQFLSLDNRKIYETIVSCDETKDELIMNLIANQPDFITTFVLSVKEAYNNRDLNFIPWLRYKSFFAEYLIIMKSMNNRIESEVSASRQRIAE